MAVCIALFISAPTGLLCKGHVVQKGPVHFRVCESVLQTVKHNVKRIAQIWGRSDYITSTGFAELLPLQASWFSGKQLVSKL